MQKAFVSRCKRVTPTVLPDHQLAHSLCLTDMALLRLFPYRKNPSVAMATQRPCCLCAAASAARLRE